MASSGIWPRVIDGRTRLGKEEDKGGCGWFHSTPKTRPILDLWDIVRNPIRLWCIVGYVFYPHECKQVSVLVAETFTASLV